LVVVQHRKPEGPSFLVVSFDSMAGQWHGLNFLFEDAGVDGIIGQTEVKSSGVRVRPKLIALI
jgi:hypothetical protein